MIFKSSAFRLCHVAIASCLVLLLSACTGSAHQLPQVSSAEMTAVQHEFEKKKLPARIYERSDAANRALIAGASRRLAASAKPLCVHTGYASCYFQTLYNPGGTVNAFASGKGKITIYRGLMRYLGSEEEVAAVVAHEMGHHLANHQQEKLQNAATGAVITGVLTAVVLAAANQHNTNYTVFQRQQNEKTLNDMTMAGAQLGALSYSKEEEREADLLGAYLLARAGYNLRKAEKLLALTIKMDGAGDISKSAFGDSHPSGYERVAAWRKAIDEVRTNKTKLPFKKTH
jgi:predicted Zn-dependent protease